MVSAVVRPRWIEPVPVTVSELVAALKVRVVLLVSVLLPSPGARMAPLPMVVLPPRVPEPERVPLLFTVTTLLSMLPAPLTPT